MLVQVENFLYPADFVVVDMKEEDDFSIILGRPFLATARTIIDVQQGKLTFKFDDKEVTLKNYNFKNPSYFTNNFHSADITISYPFQEPKGGDPLENLANSFDCSLMEQRRVALNIMLIEADMTKGTRLPTAKVKSKRKGKKREGRILPTR